jgi:hypothetical protein
VVGEALAPALAAPVVEVVQAAELGLVVVAEALAPALAVPVVEVAQGAEHLEALLVPSALRERRERRPANG